MMLRIPAIAVFYFVVSCGIGQADDSGEPIQQVELEQLPWERLVEMMQDEQAAYRRRGQIAFIRQYENMVNSLVRFVNNRPREPFHEFTDERLLAAEVIGHAFASRKAIRALVQNAESGPSRQVDDLSEIGRYPNALALRQIGLNAVPEIVLELDVVPPDRLTDHAVQLYAHIILGIYGPDFMGGHEEALRVMKGYRDRAWKKTNLDRLLDAMQDISKEKLTD